MLAVLFSFGYVMFVCCEYDVSEYGVRVVWVLWYFNVCECMFNFLCKFFPVCFVVVCVGVSGLL